MDMTIDEALIGVTLNAAGSLDGAQWSEAANRAS